MIKKIGFIISLSAGLFIFTQGNAQVTVNMFVPGEIVAGKEFNVNIEIEKGSLEEFSRFQQELPVGLAASPDQSETADFTFENQRVRFIWLKLPKKNVINISYKVMVNERLKGQFDLEGEFSYVEGDERKTIAAGPATITITPSPTIVPSAQVDISDFSEVLAAEKEAIQSSHDITCLRQTPYKTVTGNDFIVRILVYKKEMNKFAKIEEEIPAGFNAMNMDSKAGIFTFKDGIAKFVWMTLPPQSGFVIAYRLMPEGSRTVADLNINGKFSYIEQGRNIDVPIVQQSVDLSNVDETNVEDFLAALESGESPVPAGEKEAVVLEDEPVVTEEPPEKKPVRETEPVVDREPFTKEQRPTKYEDIPPTMLLPVETGIYYRVQLAAAHIFVDPVSIYKKYGFTRPVKIEVHDGWYKYSIGSFPNYREAKEFREMVVTRKKISGAFITAYRNGDRITVQQALKQTGER
jgi:hypothetical protein